MKLQTMFQKDINRNINGVVKMDQNDEASLRQELEEYIITRELRRHFSTFLDRYAGAIDQPTDKIGVWISGFFGSGKSHFLKILSYLLTNQTVAGKKTLDHFRDKFDDPKMYADAEKCASVPTESILFNIDNVAPGSKDKTVILRVFAKVFYDHLGFYGDDLKVAKLERHIRRQGKEAEFREAFERVHGDPWEKSRDSFAFFEDDVVEVLQTALGMSEQAARNWFNGTETNELSIDQLVDDIKAYVDGKGKNFRLLFMVDEVGQFIGDDGSLMLNLQTIVEELGSRCRGRVWVMVTSQEAIDSVVKIAGDDFSKIQGRFDTRLSLSSSSVDEVIQKRVLQKTDDADRLLRMTYEREQASLRNLFAFSDSVKDLKGFTAPEEFSSAFPFVPYQFILIQKVLAEIRKHGNSGKHLSGGERSMLSGFQEAAQKLQDRDERALAPFCLFYDTIHTFLESAIRQVIDRCQRAADNGDGIEPQDVGVLKLLYLIRYSTDIKPNVENIAILMIDSIDADKLGLKSSVARSLDRLVRQNYVSRDGDRYTFLTDEEQAVADDIKKTPVDAAQIVESIAQTVYGEIYPGKKYRRGRSDFDFDKYIDETLHGSGTGSGIRLRIVTMASSLHGMAREQYVLESQRDNAAILALSDESPYFADLEQALKIKKYAKGNISQKPESVQEIILGRQKQARDLEKRARDYLERAIAGAAVFVCGEALEIRAGSAKEKIDRALDRLVESVYDKLELVTRPAESDADILSILKGEGAETALAGSGSDNEEALREILQWLELPGSQLLSLSMRDVQKRYSGIPYGWREIDIAALMARLAASQKVTLKYGGAPLARDDRKFPDYLRKKSLVDQVMVTRRVAPGEELMRKSREVLREYLSQTDIPRDEDGLVRFVTGTFEERAEKCQKLLAEYGKGRYPGKGELESALGLFQGILAQRRDNVALLKELVRRQDDLMDAKEDLAEVEDFFRVQRDIFDEAAGKLERLEQERSYFEGETEAREALREISAILAAERPYSRIQELPGLTETPDRVYNELLEAKRPEVEETIRRCMEEIHLAEKDARGGEEILRRAEDQFQQKREAAKTAGSLTTLDAIITQAETLRRTTCARLTALVPAPEEAASQRAGQAAARERVATLRPRELCGVRRLRSEAEIDGYLEEIRGRLRAALRDADAVEVRE